MESQITPEEDTTIKQNIEAEFVYLSRVCVPKMRQLLTSPAPGNPFFMFLDFKERFDALFVLSMDKKELNKDIVAAVKAWVESETTFNLQQSTVREGLDLFNKYKAELFRANILKHG